MLSLGQLTSLPPRLAANPFYRLLVQFSRSKIGSFEWLFTLERYLVRYAWVALPVMCALVWPPLEELDYISDGIRLVMLLYPCLFIWSLTRVAGVELMQLVLEGHWTSEILASPLTDRDLRDGFITPIILILRQYSLISIFSLALYGVESSVIVFANDVPILDDLWLTLWVSYAIFVNTIAWILFVYLGRLFAEVRLRNGLLKGLATLAVLIGGVLLMLGYTVLFIKYPHRLIDSRVVAGILALIAGLMGAAGVFYWKLSGHFRRYLYGQLGIDLLIYDDVEPYATAWSEEPLSRPPPSKKSRD